MMVQRRQFIRSALALPLASSAGLPFLLASNNANAADVIIQIDGLTQTPTSTPLRVSATYMTSLVCNLMSEVLRQMKAVTDASIGSVTGAWTEFMLQPNGRELVARPFNPYNVATSAVSNVGVVGLVNNAMQSVAGKNLEVSWDILVPAVVIVIFESIGVALIQEHLIVHLVQVRRFQVEKARILAWAMAAGWQGFWSGYLIPKVFNSLVNHYQTIVTDQSDLRRLRNALYKETVGAADFATRLFNTVDNGYVTFINDNYTPNLNFGGTLTWITNLSLGGNQYVAQADVVIYDFKPGTYVSVIKSRSRSSKRAITDPVSPWLPSIYHSYYTTDMTNMHSLSSVAN